MITLLVTVLSLHSVLTVCPKSDLIDPCKCRDDSIVCDGEHPIDLVKIFERLSQNTATKAEKHFKWFFLNNTSITELKANTFKDITFDKIEIKECPNLKTISENAFSQTDLVTKEVIFYENGNLQSGPGHSIFKSLSKFINIEKITITHPNITEIPNNAFEVSVGYQDKLTYFYFYGPSLTKLGDRAFAKLRKLEQLFLIRTSIDHISEHAFEFEDKSDRVLKLSLVLNKFMDKWNYSNMSLTHFKRPVLLDFGWNDNNVEYLEEKVLHPFLKSNAKNSISLKNVYIDCTDCRSYWVKKERGLIKRFLDARCLVTGRSLDDLFTLSSCKHIKHVDKPCRWSPKENKITCDGLEKVKLQDVFRNLSKTLPEYEKHFSVVQINNTSIESVDENSFDDLVFDQIFIVNCTKLKSIHKKAFEKTLNTTEVVVIKNCTKLVSPDN